MSVKRETATRAAPSRRNSVGSTAQESSSALAGDSRPERSPGLIGAGLQRVADSPLATVAGVAAVSAGIALLLPSSRREAEVMGEVASKIGEVAREAADTAIETGRQQVEDLAMEALAGVGGTILGSLVEEREE